MTYTFSTAGEKRDRSIFHLFSGRCFYCKKGAASPSTGCQAPVARRGAPIHTFRPFFSASHIPSVGILSARLPSENHPQPRPQSHRIIFHSAEAGPASLTSAHLLSVFNANNDSCHTAHTRYGKVAAFSH